MNLNESFYPDHSLLVLTEPDERNIQVFKKTTKIIRGQCSAMNTSLANIQRDGTCTLDIFRAKCFPDNTQWCSHIDWAAVLMKIMAKWRFLNVSESDAVICSAHLSRLYTHVGLYYVCYTKPLLSFHLCYCVYCVITSRNRCIEPSCRLCFSLMSIHLLKWTCCAQLVRSHIGIGHLTSLWQQVSEAKDVV